MISRKLPNAFVERMSAQLGIEKAEFFESLEEDAPISIRLNPAKNDIKPSYEKVPWTSFGYYLKERPQFTLDPAFHAGAYYVQEAGSMLIEIAVNQIKESTKISIALDLCAAPGGKSTHLLSLLDEDCLLVSNEVINSRTLVLLENLMKWGHSNTVVTNLDPKAFNKLPAFFNLILVDAPCSGEGLFRKDLNAREEWSEANAENCALRQERILKDIVPALASEGYIIYSTCTYNPDENIRQVEQLVNEYGFTSINLKHEVAWGLKEIEGKNCKGYQAFPHKTKAEGFFISLLKGPKKEAITKRQSRKLNEYKNKNIDLSKYLDTTKEYFYFEAFANEVSFINAKHKTGIEEIIGNISIKKAGRSLGEIKNKDFIPSHELALSIEANKDIPTYTLDNHNALQYLRRNDFVFDKDLNGWYLIAYNGLPLGWAKFISGRANNKLPNNSRIRNL